MATNKLYATGGQLSKSINRGFYPTNYTVPMLGFGDFLKNNAGGIGTVLGSIGGLFLGNPMLGAQIGGSIGGAVEGPTKSQVEDEQNKLMADHQKQLMLQQLNDGTLVAAMGGKFNPSNKGNFFQPRRDGEKSYPLKEWADRRKGNSFSGFGGGSFGGAGAGTVGGGSSTPVTWTDLRTPIELASFNEAFRSAKGQGLPEFEYNGKKYNTELAPDSSFNPKAGTYKPQGRLRMVFDENNVIQNDSTRFEPELGQPIVLPIDKGVKENYFNNGGMLPSYAGGGVLDNITEYAEGGFHETNPNGGIPLGDKALVEQGEVRYNSKKYGDYIFSNRF